MYFQKKIKILEGLLADKRKLLIVLHDNPDPDAIASGMALGHLVKTTFNTNYKIVYGGIIGRAENVSMVNELKIPLVRAEKIRFHRYPVTALVDTQYKTGNNSLPDSIFPDIVIDHHPKRMKRESAFQIIDSSAGVNCTILVEFLQYLNVKIPRNLATALVYGISSETQNLGREASQRDINAYLYIYPMANMKKLSHIIFPKLSQDYYIVLHKALEKGFYFQNILGSHLGEVPYPELIPEIADFLVRRKGTTLAFCTGIYNENLFISMRTTNTRRKIPRMIKKVVGKIGSGGGHTLIGGGKIPLKNSPYSNVIDLQDSINRKVLLHLGMKQDCEWKPLMPV